MSKKVFEEFNLENEIDKKIKILISEGYKGDEGDEYKDNILTISNFNSNYNKYCFNNNTRFNIKSLCLFRNNLINFDNSYGKGNIKNYYFQDVLFSKGVNKKYIGTTGAIIGNNDNIINEVELFYVNNSIDNGIFGLYSFKINNIIIHNDNRSYKDIEYRHFEKYIVKFDKIEIKNNKLLNNLLIDNIEIGELILESINNNFESFEIRNCKIDKLVVRNSNLGKAVFNGVEIGELEIENATLNDCIFNGVDFKTYELTEIKKENSVNYKIMKDNYRQLKHVMDKNGNHTEANEFYSKEMLYYLKELNKNSDKINYKNSLKMLFDTKSNITGKYGERLILVFGYFINKYGTDIIFNIFVISYYLIFIYSLSFSSNYLYPEKPIYSHIICLLLVLIIIGLMIMSNKNINTKVKKVKKNQLNIGYVILIMIIGVITGVSVLHEIKYDTVIHSEIHFEGIKTFIYLLNPFSGLTPNSMSHLYWTEQIGMIVHKIFYGILIYQLIIALKRTTRR